MQHILILDDDFELAIQWRKMLEGEGYGVCLCHKASDALLMVEEEHFSLFIVDLIINTPGAGPREGGISFLQQIYHSRNEMVRETPIIGMSGYKPRGDSELAHTLFSGYGIACFLEKPFTSPDLLAAVNTVLRPAPQTPDSSADGS